MDLPAFQSDGQWFFFQELSATSNGLVSKLFSPYRNEKIANERREAVIAFTRNAPVCHHSRIT